MNVERIQLVVAEYYRIKIGDLLSDCRRRCYARPRQVGMVLTRELTSMSFPDIGLAFRGKNHATVIHACKQITKLANSDERIKADLTALRMKLKGETNLSVDELRLAVAAATNEPPPPILVQPPNYQI